MHRHQFLAVWTSIGALLAFFSVAMGAFAAHGLKSILNPYELSIIQTAATYQMYHGLAIILVSIVVNAVVNAEINMTLSTTAAKPMDPSRKIILGFERAGNTINRLFLLGVFCFSGSLYLLALTNIKFVAFITPIGGILMLFSWAYFAYSCFWLRKV